MQTPRSLLAVACCLLVCGCGRHIAEAPVKQPEREFTFSFSHNVTPVERSAEGYSGFEYRIRRSGEKDFLTFLPESIKPTDDGSVVVLIKVTVPYPQDGEVFDVQSSYMLDGELHESKIQRTILASSKPPR